LLTLSVSRSQSFLPEGIGSHGQLASEIRIGEDMSQSFLKASVRTE